MNGSRRVAPAVCALLLLAGGRARNPVSGRAQVTLVSEAKERELSEAEARKVTETMGIYDDAALADYVRAVGERLARVSPRQGFSYTFQVVDMQEPNAFAPWRRVGWGWKAVASAGAGKLRTRGDERMG